MDEDQRDPEKRVPGIGKLIRTFTDGAVDPAKKEVDPPSAILVKLERIEREDGPLIRLPYEDGSGATEHYDFPPGKNVFLVPAIVAEAAVASGFFRAVE